MDIFQAVFRIDHPDMGKHPQNARHADIERETVEAKGFACLQQEHRRLAFVGKGAHRTGPQGTFYDDGRAECHGEFRQIGTARGNAYLRQVVAMDRRRMDIDAQRAAIDDMGEEAVRQLSGQTAMLRAGEASIEIAPVGQIAAVRGKTVYVDGRRKNDRPCQHFGRQAFEQSLDHGCADDLVTVNGSADENAGPAPRAMHHAKGKRRVQARHLLTDGNGNGRLRPRRDPAFVNDEMFFVSFGVHLPNRHNGQHLGKRKAWSGCSR